LTLLELLTPQFTLTSTQEARDMQKKLEPAHSWW